MGRDFLGTDLDYQQADNIDACLQLCYNHPDCTFVSYATYGTCYLKKDFMNGPDGINGWTPLIERACLLTALLPEVIPDGAYSHVIGASPSPPPLPPPR